MITITGDLSGDGECWCLEVSEEMYRQVVGEEAYQRELKDRETFKEDMDLLYPHDFGPQSWRLYPGDIFSALGVKSCERVTFKIELVK